MDRPDIVWQVEKISEQSEVFNYFVQLSGMNVHIGKAAESLSFSIASTIEFDPETLTKLTQEQDKRRTLLTHFENVLTTALDWYMFIDVNGKGRYLQGDAIDMARVPDLSRRRVAARADERPHRDGEHPRVPRYDQ